VQHERERLSSIFKNSYQERGAAFEEIINLLSSSLERLVLAETYWDELALFTRGTPGVALPIKNIDVYLKENNIEGFWVYSDEGTLRYSRNDLEAASLAELPLLPEEIKGLFARSKTCRFFLRTSKGFMEICGATIHPSDDFERKTIPCGYLFLGKLYDQAYLERIANISRCRILILEPDAEQTPGMSGSSAYIMQFAYALRSWNGEPIGVLQGVADPIFMKSFNRVSSYSFLILFLFIASILMVSIVFLKRWVINPLHLVFRTLSTHNGAYVHSLLSHGDDFGDMARLITRSFIQKDALVAEMANRARLEAEVSLARQRFLEIVDKIPVGVVLCRMREDAKDFVVTDFNEAAIQAAGGTREEFLGKTIWEVFSPVEDSTFFEEARQVFVTGKFHKRLKRAGDGGLLTQYQEIYMHKLFDDEIVLIGGRQPA
jgi:PAS domain-containing protein